MKKLGQRFKILGKIESVKSFIHTGVYKRFYRPHLFPAFLKLCLGSLMLWQINSESTESH